MSDFNRIILIGRVGTDPEYKWFESGALLTKFTLANNLFDSKNKEDVTHWFNVDTFSKLAEHIKKGYMVAVEGKLKADTWKDDAGNNKKRVYIFAENLQILTQKKKENEEKNTENEQEIVKFHQILQEEIPF